MRNPSVLLLFPPLLLGLSGCGREAERLTRELNEQRAVLQQVQAAAAAEREEHAARLEFEQGLLSDVGALLRGEIAGIAAEPRDADDLIARANRVLRVVSEQDELLWSSDAGWRLYVAGRMRAAAWLADPAVGLCDRAREIARETLEAVQAAFRADESNRRLAVAVGDAHAGLARVEMAAGDHAAAIEQYRIGVDALLASDKGRGDGTGSSEFQGAGSGGGGGKGKGKGKNRDQSIALKRHLMHVYDEFIAAYHATGDAEGEVRTINEARHTAGDLCQVLRNGEDNAFQFARVCFATLIDRLAEGAERLEGREPALVTEELALRIVREVHAEVPDEPTFFEPIVPHAIEVARRLAGLGKIDELRELGTQTLADLEVLAQMDYPAARRAELEARLCLEMARGLASVDEHRAEADEWYGRALELARTMRAAGGLEPTAAALESAAQAGLATASE